MDLVQNLRSLEAAKPHRQYYQTTFKTESLPNLVAEENIFIHKAITINDMRKVFNTRWEGYKKYFNHQTELIDLADFSPHATLLLAEDEHNKTLGTLRILDRRYGKIELDEFIDVDSVIPENPGSCIEATRFSIPSHSNSKSIKLLLWKALLCYCQINCIDTIVMSARPAAARAYRCLLFEDAGPLGVYCHSLLGNLEHRTYKCNISERKYVMKEKDQSLYHFFFLDDYPKINTANFKLFAPEIESISKAETSIPFVYGEKRITVNSRQQLAI